MALIIPNAIGTTSVNITYANWKLVLRAWL